MESVLVETRFLGAPSLESELDLEALEAYVDRLIDLRTLCKDSCIRVFRSDLLFEVLEQEGTRPPWGRSPFDGFFQDGDVSTLFLSILERTTPVQDYTGITDVLIDEFSCSPGAQHEARTQRLREDYARMVTTWRIWLVNNGENDSGGMLASEFDQSEAVTVEGTVLALEGAGRDCFTLPMSLTWVVNHTSTLEGLTEVVDPIELWLNGKIECGLRWHLAARRLTNVRNWLAGSGDYRFHSDFDQSLNRHDFRSDEGRVRRLLRACSDTILNERMGLTHRLRTGPAGGAPPRRRSIDGAYAWRRDIDHDFHLHYWKQGKSVEFAVVVPHDDFSIPE